MEIVTLDLDDTLLSIEDDYKKTWREFGEFMEKEYNISATEAIQKSKEINKELLDEMGLSLERFPQSFIQTLFYFVDSPPEEHIGHVDGLARTAYKSKEEYAERGFMDGAEEMLSILREQVDELYIITAGVPSFQKRKINALELDEICDDSYVVPMNTKDKCLNRICEGECDYEDVFHVGNSLQSDVKAALEAGVNSVYIPNGTKWRDTEKEIDYYSHPDIFYYENHHEFNYDLKNGFF